MKSFFSISVQQSSQKSSFWNYSLIFEHLSIRCELPMIANTHMDKSSYPENDYPPYKELSTVPTLHMSLVGKLNYVSVVSRPHLVLLLFFESIASKPIPKTIGFVYQSLEIPQGLFRFRSFVQEFRRFQISWLLRLWLMGVQLDAIVSKQPSLVVLFVGLIVKNKQLLRLLLKCRKCSLSVLRSCSRVCLLVVPCSEFSSRSKWVCFPPRWQPVG